MRYPGYRVSAESGRALLVRTTFDETDLDPATNWKQAWQNQNRAALSRGYVELEDALVFAAQMLASTEGKSLDLSEAVQAGLFRPEWIKDRCEIESLSHLLGENLSRSAT